MAPIKALKKEASLKSKDILIIEDDIYLVEAYQRKFQKEGLEVNVISDGRTALTVLSQEPPSIVLLDLMLPGMSGLSILDAIKKNDRWKDVPVIILSNLGQPQDIGKALSLGAVDFMVKANVNLGEIVDRVKKFL